ncbi:FliH/SctL family protein [Adhaeretor mobilis]|nr:FliH/SctL family protein [Adhaeretor mobilis]
MATIIKREYQQTPDGSRLTGVAYNLTDMAGQAESLLTDVRARAAEIIKQAQQEAKQIRTQAEAQGRAAAEAAIERVLDQKVAQQMKTLEPALQGAVQQIEESRQEWLQHWESSAVGLSAAIAGRIVRAEIAKRPEISIEWMREALELAAGSSELTIRLHPQDHATIAKQVEQLAATFNPLANAKIEPDESITLSGCRVETSFGSIDQQLETQLDRIQQELS